MTKSARATRRSAGARGRQAVAPSKIRPMATPKATCSSRDYGTSRHIANSRNAEIEREARDRQRRKEAEAKQNRR